MNLSFHSLASQVFFSFKDTMVTSLTQQQSKIKLMTFIAVACLAAYCVFRYYDVIVATLRGRLRHVADEGVVQKESNPQNTREEIQHDALSQPLKKQEVAEEIESEALDLKETSSQTQNPSLATLSPLPVKVDINPIPYNLEARVAKVQELSRTLPLQGKKLALFVGRTTDEPLPQEENVQWVSLDVVLGSYADVSRLHLEIDFSDRNQTVKIQKLFDKIVVDPSVLKGFKEDPWRHLGRLLRPTKEATLITETDAGFYLFAERAAEEQPRAYDSYIYKRLDGQYFDKCTALYYAEVQKYLKTLYREVEYVQDQVYPYAVRDEDKTKLSSYFVLKNSWQSRLNLIRIGQEIRTKNGTLPND